MFTVVYVAAKWVRISSFFTITNVNVFRRKHRKSNVVIIIIYVFITESKKMFKFHFGLFNRILQTKFILQKFSHKK